MATASLKTNATNKRYYQDFSGGINLFLGPRQIKDNESPDAVNCDFKGKGGVGNRQGYDQIGTVGATYDHGIYGMAAMHTATIHQLIKFASNGSNVVLNSCDDGTTWTAVTGTTFTDALNMDVAQAAINTTSYLFSGNGTDAMAKYDGTSWTAATNGTIGYNPVYYAKRLWVIDENNKDTLNFSAEYNDATNPLQFTGSHSSTVTFLPGSGEEVIGLIPARIGGNHALYVFLPNAIYMIQPASSADTWTVTLITSSIGAISRRSIANVGDDIYFAADDGVYALGEVANYTNVRTTNKSARVQEVFDALTATNKAKLVGIFHNFKYHLSYSLGGTTNDSCLVYDIRYGAWQDWRNIAANDATLFTTSAGATDMYFGHPTSGAVYKMYSGSTDDGTAISSYWKSKSFDEGVFDVTKLYLDTTWNLGALNGLVTLTVIFNDTEIASTKTLAQQNPTGGAGRVVAGRAQMTADNTDLAVGGAGRIADSTSVDMVINLPQRMRAKGQKFAIQYKIANSNGSTWRLDGISQTLIPFDHYKFRSDLKLT